MKCTWIVQINGVVVFRKKITSYQITYLRSVIFNSLQFMGKWALILVTPGVWFQSTNNFWVVSDVSDGLKCQQARKLNMGSKTFTYQNFVILWLIQKSYCLGKETCFFCKMQNLQLGRQKLFRGELRYSYFNCINIWSIFAFFSHAFYSVTRTILKGVLWFLPWIDIGYCNPQCFTVIWG